MKESDSNELINMESEFELKALKKRILELEREVAKLVDIIKDNDLEDEIEGMDHTSDEEFICINEIHKLKELSDKGLFTQDEAKTLDILYKNLRMIRGLSSDKPKGKAKEADIGKLLEIVTKK